MSRLIIMLGITPLLLGGVALAGKYNQVLSVGDQAPAWEDLPGVDGQKHSLSDLAKEKVLVIAFTCNSCPYAVDAEKRLVALQKKYSDRGVSLVAINVSKEEEDLMPAMKRTASEKGFKFPYLFDESQKIARDFGAKYTPEMYVLDGDRKVVYMGSLDDSPDGTNVQKRYVELAIEAALSGSTPEMTETVPIGCRVRYERQRRSRSSR